ncbi:MAG: hypothetical protein ABSG97_08300 [Sedimentisphaerales bacterium]
MSGKRFWFCKQSIGAVEDTHKGILRDLDGDGITIFTNAVKYAKSSV